MLSRRHTLTQVESEKSAVAVANGVCRVIMSSTPSKLWAAPAT
jgi:hypothetical protein